MSSDIHEVVNKFISEFGEAYLRDVLESGRKRKTTPESHLFPHSLFNVVVTMLKERFPSDSFVLIDEFGESPTISLRERRDSIGVRDRITKFLNGFFPRTLFRERPDGKDFKIVSCQNWQTPWKIIQQITNGADEDMAMNVCLMSNGKMQFQLGSQDEGQNSRNVTVKQFFNTWKDYYVQKSHKYSPRNARRNSPSGDAVLWVFSRECVDEAPDTAPYTKRRCLSAPEGPASPTSSTTSTISRSLSSSVPPPVPLHRQALATATGLQLTPAHAHSHLHATAHAHQPHPQHPQSLHIVTPQHQQMARPPTTTFTLPNSLPVSGPLQGTQIVPHSAALAHHNGIAVVTPAAIAVPTQQGIAPIQNPKDEDRETVAALLELRTGGQAATTASATPPTPPTQDSNPAALPGASVRECAALRREEVNKNRT